MRGVLLHSPGDVRVEDREVPAIVEPTDAVLKVAAACVCGSDLWPYRGLEDVDGPAPMGHEYVGTVEQVGADVRTVQVGDFVLFNPDDDHDGGPGTADGFGYSIWYVPDDFVASAVATAGNRYFAKPHVADRQMAGALVVVAGEDHVVGGRPAAKDAAPSLSRGWEAWRRSAMRMAPVPKAAGSTM